MEKLPRTRAERWAFLFTREHLQMQPWSQSFSTPLFCGVLSNI